MRRPRKIITTHQGVMMHSLGTMALCIEGAPARLGNYSGFFAMLFLLSFLLCMYAS